MPEFYELIDIIVERSLTAISESETAAIEALNVSARTIDITALQTCNLHRAVLCVGCFSMFDAELQQRLACTNGFETANSLLKEAGKLDLFYRFQEAQNMVNVLKHGLGRSHSKLEGSELLKPLCALEGDVSEVPIYVDVSNDLVRKCSALIKEVTVTLKMLTSSEAGS